MRIKYLFSLLFICFVTVGCSHHSDEFDGKICNFMVRFVDKEGKDLATDVKMKDAYEILRTEYNLKTYWNGELIKPENKNMSIYFTKEFHSPMFYFSIHTSQPQFGENKIDFHIIFLKIFGDEEKHILSARWVINEKEYEYKIEVFESLTYEGKEIPVKIEDSLPIYVITVE